MGQAHYSNIQEQRAGDPHRHLHVADGHLAALPQDGLVVHPVEREPLDAPPRDPPERLPPQPGRAAAVPRSRRTSSSRRPSTSPAPDALLHSDSSTAINRAPLLRRAAGARGADGSSLQSPSASPAATNRVRVSGPPRRSSLPSPARPPHSLRLLRRDARRLTAGGGAPGVVR